MAWQAVANEEHRKRPYPGLATWERNLASVIARKFELLEPEELEAELIRTVLDLKARAPPHVRDWEKYLAKALHNRANNWNRNRRDKAKRETVLPEPDQEALHFFSVNEADLESQVAFADVWRELGPELTELWELLIETRGNVTEVARRLGKHRNTVRLWIRKIQQVLIHHGLQPGAPAEKTLIRESRRDTGKAIAISSQLLQTLVRKHLSGSQWRIVLWVIRETSRRKQRMTPFRWSRIAHDLRLDRGAACRAGRRLLGAKLLFIRDGRIGLRKEHP